MPCLISLLPKDLVAAHSFLDSVMKLPLSPFSSAVNRTQCLVYARQVTMAKENLKGSVNILKESSQIVSLSFGIPNPGKLH